APLVEELLCEGRRARGLARDDAVAVAVDVLPLGGRIARGVLPRSLRERQGVLAGAVARRDLRRRIRDVLRAQALERRHLRGARLGGLDRLRDRARALRREIGQGLTHEL